MNEQKYEKSIVYCDPSLILKVSDGTGDEMANVIDSTPFFLFHWFF